MEYATLEYIYNNNNNKYQQKQIQSTHKKNVRERSIVLLGFLLKSYIEVLNC
jgi:hypothetical protein